MLLLTQIRIRESLHLSGFLFLCVLLIFLICFCLKETGKEGEMNGSSILFCKHAGEMTSSVLLGCRIQISSVFLDRRKRVEKLCFIKLCVALIILICASGVAYQSHEL